MRHLLSSQRIIPLAIFSLLFLACGDDDTSPASKQNPPSALFAIDEEPAGENCPSGGVRICIGTDEDSDGALSLDEIKSTQYICHGQNGQSGTSGNSGKDGHSPIIEQGACLPADAECAVQCGGAGQRFAIGFDKDGDGALNSDEIDAHYYVCDQDRFIEFIAIPAGNGYFQEWRAPSHSFSAFEIMKTLVTVDMFEAYLRANPADVSGYQKYDSDDAEQKFCNLGAEDKSRHPMNCLSAAAAERFCRWIGGRLPDANEWRYAATHDGIALRGTDYPWGNDAPIHCVHANTWKFDEATSLNYCDGHRETDTPLGTSAVGAYPAGNSPLGIADLTGNVSEWTASLVAEDSKRRILRGESWRGGAHPTQTPTQKVDAAGVTTSEVMSSDLGFRCAR